MRRSYARDPPRLHSKHTIEKCTRRTLPIVCIGLMLAKLTRAILPSAERKVTLDFYHNAATPGETGISTATLEVEFNIDAVDGGSAVLAVKAATLSSDVPIDDIVRAAQSAKGGKGLGATSGFAFLLREVRARLESWRRGGAFKCPR